MAIIRDVQLGFDTKTIRKAIAKVVRYSQALNKAFEDLEKLDNSIQVKPIKRKSVK